jgi:hypothetical protein
MYWRFGAMIATSTAVMFLLTYTNVWVLDHVRYSQERVYMALLMGASMAVIMLGAMWGLMYRNRRVNVAIMAGALVLGAVALVFSRAQVFVTDSSYLRAMIPHHSIAILTSERADIDDVRVRGLADEIMRTQRIEIAEMAWLVADIAEHGIAATEEDAEDRPVPDFDAVGGP